MELIKVLLENSVYCVGNEEGLNEDDGFLLKINNSGLHPWGHYVFPECDIL